MTATRARVRGVYATALTAVLRDAGVEVVQASPPIRRRFDADFPVAVADATVDATDDRQGVCVTGAPDAVADVAELAAGVALDGFDWPAAAPRGAVYDAVVDRTTGGGAVLALDDEADGYLPFDAVDDYVAEGDRLRVQVRDPAPPWADRRSRVSPEIVVRGDVASLVRGRDALVAGTPDGTAEHELVRTTEVLSAEVPEGWAVRWERGAEGADVDALNAALEDAVERAGRLDAALADAPETGDAGSDSGPGSEADAATAPIRVAAPEATTWVWFGRACRFALDDARRTAAPTMAGHHRVKAASPAASTAVDFAEGVCGGSESFPFAAVSRTFGPGEGDRVAIGHGKPDGRCIVLGRGEVTECDVDEATVTLRREMSAGGTYDALGVAREAGDVATTRFREGRWWYPTVYRGADGAVKGTYVNVNTPLELFPDAVRYVDLHVDVVRHADGAVEVVDEDELRASVEDGHVDEALAAEARSVADRIADSIGD